ncbi:MAG: DUF4270 domain-containing protein [Bacteroidetes bacterium]|nr:DUF4270 domain-containing protein [Bacteroidota bacterium]
MKKKDLWIVAVIMTIVVLFSSCSGWEQDLGQDLLPPGDNVFLFHDTIFEIDAYTATGYPIVTSDISYSGTKVYLVGQMEDTIVGSSDATIFTQINTTTTFHPANNTEIDSIMLSLYINNYVGDMEQDFTIRIHEATERVYFDSLYLSNHETEGNYNPVWLAEKTVTPTDNDTIEILIQDQAFIQKFLDVQADTALFNNDSIFKDYFNGFYLTAFSSAQEGAIARVGLSNRISRLSVKYANDSTEVDSTAERDFVWATFGINEYSSQKINVFEHDHSNVYLSKIIDNETLEIPLCYTQGMAGADVRFSFPSLDEWIEGGKVAINSAKMIFDIIPEENSGIALADLPTRMMLFTEQEGDTLTPLYDYVALYSANQGDGSQFGGQLRAESKGMFYDTTYSYSFNMALHFQSMVDGATTDHNFRLQVYDAIRNPKVSKLWSNLYTNPKRIRLEVVYIKL